MHRKIIELAENKKYHDLAQLIVDDKYTLSEVAFHLKNISNDPYIQLLQIINEFESINRK